VPHSPSDDLALALRLAGRADALLMRGFRSPALAVEVKADGTPVTPVDRDVDAAVRGELARARGGDAVLAEESGATGGSRRRWIVDPLDGTKNYVRGVPVFACLIALECDGALVLGVASAPALGLRWWAERGAGAYRNGERMQVSSVAALRDAEVLHSGLGAWRRHDRLAGLLALERASRRTRGFGDFWPFVLVAEGAAEVAVEPGGLQPWDLAALRVVVEEAGGRLTSLDGDPESRDGSALASNGMVHDAALAVLGDG